MRIFLSRMEVAKVITTVEEVKQGRVQKVRNHVLRIGRKGTVKTLNSSILTSERKFLKEIRFINTIKRLDEYGEGRY